MPHAEPVIAAPIQREKTVAELKEAYDFAVWKEMRAKEAGLKAMSKEFE
jgi:hypothetical protein